MSSALVSVSGVRGIIGDSFTEDVVRRWTLAFAVFCRSEPFDFAQGNLREEPPSPRPVGLRPPDDRCVVLGRDTRPSGVRALETAAETLREHGVRPILCGVVPTPTLQLAVTHHSAAGGLIITASHNPQEWNGLKFLGPYGVFLSAEDMEQLHQSVILRSQEATEGSRRSFAFGSG